MDRSSTRREFDSESGFYYYRARYYDPNVGRFLSEDPIGRFGGTNFYRYVRNSPLKLIDPFGYGPWGAGIGGVAGGIVGGILGLTGGAAGGTLVAPGVGTVGGAVGGTIEGVAQGTVIGAALGAAIGDLIQDWLKSKPAPKCDKNKDECWERYLEERAFCSRYYGTRLYGMCRSRALARYEACRDKLPDPGPLDPLQWPDAADK